MFSPKTPPLHLDKNKDHLKYFTVLFIAFLQGAFKGRDPGDFKWCEDTDKTELVICDQSNMLTDKYVPRIVTVRGSTTPLPMFLKDFNDEDRSIGSIKRSLLMESSITFHCIAKIGIETQYIAQQVQEYLHAHYLLLHRKGLHKLDRTLNISPETPANAVFSPEVLPEGVLIAVTARFWYRHTIITTPSNLPAAREIEHHIFAAINGVDELKSKSNILSAHPGVDSKNPEIKIDIQSPPVEKI